MILTTRRLMCDVRVSGVADARTVPSHGFECVNQGNLFFTLATIIEEKRPPIIFLENVKNLRSHDAGNTWRVIEKKLKGLEYDVHAEVIDAAGWVPQHRERIYIVGFDKHVFGEKVDFTYPTRPDGAKPKVRDILDLPASKPEIHAHGPPVDLPAGLCEEAQRTRKRIRDSSLSQRPVKHFLRRSFAHLTIRLTHAARSGDGRFPESRGLRL